MVLALGCERHANDCEQQTPQGRSLRPVRASTLGARPRIPGHRHERSLLALLGRHETREPGNVSSLIGHPAQHWSSRPHPQATQRIVNGPVGHSG